MRTSAWISFTLILLATVAPGRLLAAEREPGLPEAHPPGLYVSETGELMKGGEPFAGIGVNYFNLFLRLLQNPEDTSYRDGLKVLAEYEIPFVRFMAGGYWPVDNRLYFEDKERYFELFDKVVAAAEEFGIGLIPSLFWHTATVPDLMDEPVSAWGDPASKTRAFMRTYVEELVTRYKDSPALWGWEFGNEYNLAVDLPNAAEHRPPVWPDLGTRLTRGPEDELTRTIVRSAFEEFAREVRRHDPHRIITNGNSLPRPSEWHQTQYLTWQQDTLEQFEEVLLGDSPDPMNVISVHVYELEERRFGRTTQVAELLAHLMRISKAAGKPLFIGEFGAGEENGHEAGRQAFHALLEAILDAGVPLAALWVYDFPGQDGTWNVTASNRRAYQLQALRDANRLLRHGKWLAVTGPHLTTVTSPALITVSAADPGAVPAAEPGAGLARVVIRFDGAVLADNPALPFEWTFHPARHPEGAHRFEVEATDTEGRTVTQRLLFDTEVIKFAEPLPQGQWSGIAPLSVALGIAPEDVASFELVLRPVRDGNPAHVVYQGPAAPQTLAIDTTAVEDGAYDVVARLESVFGMKYERSARVVVRNWAAFSDPFEPPVHSAWFGTIDRKRTAYRSENWAHRTGDPAAFFGDADRLVRTEDAAAHLAWEVDGVDQVELTVYAPAGAGESIDWSAVFDVVVIDDTGRRPLAVSATPGATSEAGWTRWHIRADREAQAGAGQAAKRPIVELHVHPAGVDPEHIQLGRIDIRYRISGP